MERLLYFYVLFNEHGLNCGHEHRKIDGARRCFMHYQKYYPGLLIAEHWEIVQTEDRIWIDPEVA